MQKQKYSKPFTSYREQLEILQRRGLVIPNWEEAEAFLAYCNYYRFSGYVLPFESRRHVIIPQTTFTQIRDLYEFDRTLRCFVSEAIAVVEIAMRAKAAYYLGIDNDPFLYKDKRLFRHDAVWQEWSEKIASEVERSQEKFVKHFENTYEDYPNLPIWALTELMSFGTLSKFYSGIQEKYQKPVAQCFSVPHVVLGSWLHTLTHIRNLCAHHSRLWDRY
jgi:abortive infection bacteriophage resistance protein